MRVCACVCLYTYMCVYFNELCMSDLTVEFFGTFTLATGVSLHFFTHAFGLDTVLYGFCDISNIVASPTYKRVLIKFSPPASPPVRPIKVCTRKIPELSSWEIENCFCQFAPNGAS